MDKENLFPDFMCRLRAGEQAAVNQFIRDYGAVVFRAVGKKLTQLGLSRFLDSTDICQDVLAKFFARIATHFEFIEPQDIHKLLRKMTHDQIIDELHHSLTKRRGGGCRDTQY